MFSLVVIFMYLLIIGLLSFLAYFVLKKAIKDALREYDNEKNK